MKGALLFISAFRVMLGSIRVLSEFVGCKTLGCVC